MSRPGWCTASGGADRLDRAVLERLVASIRRVLGEADGAPVVERPGSKLACQARWRERVWLPEAQDLALGQLYRRPGRQSSIAEGGKVRRPCRACPGGEALDLSAEHGDAIEQAVFWNSADRLELDVDPVFHDATTAWFECDELDVAGPPPRGSLRHPRRLIWSRWRCSDK